MAFAQLTYRESLRDIERCLRSRQTKLYHMGFRGKISRSTLADANEHRDWRIFADFARIVIDHAQTLYAEESFKLELNETVYAFDSTTIKLCLSLFPWAHFRKSQKKAAIKMHTLLNLRTHLPTFIVITPAIIHDVNLLDQLIIEVGAIYVFDRGYIHFKRLYRITKARAFFLIRAKRRFSFRGLYSQPVDKSTGLICDQIIVLTGPKVKNEYPQKLRLIRFVDPQTNESFVYVTNHFDLPAMTIVKLYKQRWQIELFFKWIKQHLRIKAFFGTSENAVKSQIWIAITVYALIAIIKKQLKIEHDLYTILQILSITPFEEVQLYQLLTDKEYKSELTPASNQLTLFDL
jgi:transposase